MLHLIVTHVFHLRKGGHSRIYQTEVHLMYIIENKFLICWPYYFIYRMFMVHEFNKGSSFCYPSVISKILKHFHIGMQDILNISPRPTQEFNITTMANMGYKWDKDQSVHYLCMKGSQRCIYNYDDPIDFDPIHVKEK